MCGIAGVLHYRERGRLACGSLLARMNARMIHRGPDGAGAHVDGPCGLAHRRLSIIDLAGGAQPMQNEDGRVWVTFNGEIYNYRRLRKELAACGHAFRTDCDTEVIVHAYEEWGHSCVEQLQGMFAFAVWDGRAQELLLARDRVGIKPLYLHDDGANLYFASEIGALLVVPGLQRELDGDAALQFLAFGFVPAPLTGLRSIGKLQPGHTLSAAVGGLPRLRRYWQRPLGTTEDRPRRAAESLRAALGRTVRSHLQSDVPLGVLLSGGIDSSAILGFAAEHVPRQVETFTVCFERDSFYDETPYARLASELHQTLHREHRLTTEGFVDLLPDFVRHMEEPVVESAAVPLLALAREIRKHVTVVLSGEGADEDLAGYEIYRKMLVLETLRRLPRGILRRGAALLKRGAPAKVARYAHWATLPLEKRYRGVCLPPHDELEPVLLPGVSERVTEAGDDVISSRYRATVGAHPLERMLALDLELWLPDDILLKADKMTMAASLELRVPFLDHEVIELCAGFAPSVKLNARQGKLPLRRAAKALVPRKVLHRAKRGFPTPLASMFRGPLGEVAASVLRASSGHGLWSAEAVVSALERHRSGEADLHRMLWMCLVFELWHQQFVAAPSSFAHAMS